MSLRALGVAAALCGGCGKLLGFGDPVLVPPPDAAAADAAADAAVDAAALDATPDAGPDAAIDGGDEADAGPTLRGSKVLRYYTESGVVEIAADLSGAEIAALVPDGGGFTVLPGSAPEPGKFVVDNLPDVPFFLRVGNELVFTASRVVDLGNDVLGRPDGRPAAPGTSLAVDVSAFQGTPDPTNYVEVYSLDNRIPARRKEWRIVDGRFTASIGWDGLSLVDGGKGDVVYITDLTRDSAASGLSYYRVGAVFKAPSFSMTDGASTPLTGTWTIPISEVFTFDWRRSQFASLFAGLNPRARLDDQRLELFANPPGYGQGATLAYADVGRTDTFDVRGSMFYVNPFPAAWTVNGYASISWSVEYLAPGATVSTRREASFTVSDRVSPFASAPIVPLVTSVRNPTIAGRSALAPQTGVGLVPTIAWDPPTFGSGAGFLLGLLELVNDGGRTNLDTVALCWTTATQIVLPPGLLQAGHSYIVYIQAVVQPGIRFDRNPWRYTLPYATADTLSEPFLP